METSLLIAKIIGIVYLSFGLGLVLNRSYYIKAFSKLMDDSTYYILGGFLAIILGLLIIQYHNKWNKDWTSIITVIGYIALIKGIALLAFPKLFVGFKNMFQDKRKLNILSPIIILFGLIFTYLGFFS